MNNEPETEPIQPLLLTVIDAGRMLAVGRTTAYELIARGDLPVVHIGRACRIPVAAVQDYVEQLRAAEHGNTPQSYSPKS